MSCKLSNDTYNIQSNMKLSLRKCTYLVLKTIIFFEFGCSVIHIIFYIVTLNETQIWRETNMTSSNRTISAVDVIVADELLRDLDAIEDDKNSRRRSPGRDNLSSSTDSGHSSGNESGLGKEIGLEEKTALLRYVEGHVVGNDTWSPGPFGERKGEKTNEFALSGK